MAQKQAVGSPVYDEVVCGELAGSATALQLPDVPVKMVRLKARSDNAGSVYVGGAGVTKADGTTDVTTGIEIPPGDAETFFVPNLNVLYRITENAGDDLTYFGHR